MGRNACVFVGEWKSKWKEERRRGRRKEAMREGSQLKLQRGCVWMKGPLTLTFFRCLSVCTYGFCKRARPDQTQSRDSPSDFKLEVNIFQKLWLRVQHFPLLFVRLVPLSKKISTFLYLLLVQHQTYFWEPGMWLMVSFSDGNLISFRSFCCDVQVFMQIWLSKLFSSQKFGTLVGQTFRTALLFSWIK